MADNRATQVEDVHGSGIYPATGPYPKGAALVRTPAALAHPEERQASSSPWPSDAALFVAGRALFGGYFLYNGLNHFLNRRMMAEYARSKGVAQAEFAVPASGLMILAGGASLISGVFPKVGAALIASFLLSVSPVMHAYWKEEDAQQRMNEMVNFMKNMALVGATLIAAGHPEPWSGWWAPHSTGALVPMRA